ncbi:MAG: polymorphic toxin-type HINT domain-containing protein [Saprospiraceae bacterium]|nr:polymorphic toxin-type HINT domain-containing protein [Saprospiraceae bacterium]
MSKFSFLKLQKTTFILPLMLLCWVMCMVQVMALPFYDNVGVDIKIEDKSKLSFLTHTSDAICTLEFDHGESIGVTYPHPIYSVTQGDWKAAGELTIGEDVLTQTGTATVVRNTKKEGRERVYNLEVKDLHNFLVGERGMVVHNAYKKEDVKNWMDDAEFLERLPKSNPARSAIAELKKMKADDVDLFDQFMDDFEWIPLELGEGGVKAWKALKNAPYLIRTNTDILEKGLELFAKGFTKVDLELASSIIIKFKTKFPNVTDLDYVKFSGYLLEARKHSNDFSSLGINTDVFSQMYKAISSPNFKFPDSDKTSQYLKEMAIKMQPSNSPPNPGFLEQLNEAIKILEEGGDVILEKGHINGIEFSIDIIEKIEKKAIHFKSPVGSSPSLLTDKIKEAAKQFRDEFEPAPSGYIRIAKVKILDLSQSDFGKSALELKVRLQNYINANGNVNKLIDDFHRLHEIQIVNEFGLHRFKVENTVVSIIQ